MQCYIVMVGVQGIGLIIAILAMIICELALHLNYRMIAIIDY